MRMRNQLIIIMVMVMMMKMMIMMMKNQRVSKIVVLIFRVSFVSLSV